MTPIDATQLLSRYQHEIEFKGVLSALVKPLAKLEETCFSPYRDALNDLSDLKAKFLDLDLPAVKIGRREELSLSDDKRVVRALEAFIPWKKGPFDIFGHQIDSEWRSDLKWSRIKANISQLAGKRVADIGCHNGYFMFRMAAENPEYILGFEPFQKHWFNFHLLQNLAKTECLDFQLLGVESMDLFPKFFDTVLCLGILYHHTDPVGILRKIYSSMKSGGELVVDCQGIEGEQAMSLTPSGRYARARGIWFLPTLSALKNWLKRAQFRDIECFFAEVLSCDEQRRTSWAPIDSLADFLDPNDSSKTIEGYPAPWRFYLKARR